MQLTEYFELIDLGESLGENPPEGNPFKLAVLSDASTQQFTKILKALFYKEGITAQVWEADYDSFHGEILNPGSEFHAFKPTHALLLFSTQKYREIFLEALSEKKETLSQERRALIQNYCNALREVGIQPIVNTLALPIERQFGNYSLKTEQSLYSSVLKLNEHLVELPGVSLLDCQYLSNKIGAQNFFDEKLWVMSKSFCSNAYLPALAKEVVSICASSLGRLTKCLVVDLDNTLWGGVIADDGLDGISVGRTGAGEAYLLLQRYLLSLKQRGYFLAVCSKNDLKMASLPFEQHPEMLLRKEDFSVFIANWEPKSENIRGIAKQLNIGTSSLVFLDDSPFEREEVRKRLPEVIVPELSEDVAEYVAILENSHLFETTTLTKEDFNRVSPAIFLEMEKKFSNFEDYLKSLKMKIEAKPFNSTDLSRISQLIQRSNQFNVRTQRFSQTECENFSKNKDKYLTLSFSLSDNLCDYGLIGLVIAEWSQRSLNILEFLMSCRVLKRGVEEFMMNELTKQALLRKKNSITVDFIASEKNQMAKSYLEKMGFEKGSDLTYQLALHSYKAKPCYFNEVKIYD